MAEFSLGNLISHGQLGTWASQMKVEEMAGVVSNLTYPSQRKMGNNRTVTFVSISTKALAGYKKPHLTKFYLSQ